MKFQSAKVVALALTGLLAVGVASVAVAKEGKGGEFRENHPRRAEVLRRDSRERHELREDKGHLGGNYNKLMSEDRSIRRQEQRDARQNGGHITRQEQHQLNQEENHLNKQIEQDEKGPAR